MNHRTLWLALALTVPVASTGLISSGAGASGVFNHVYKALLAVSEVEEDDLRDRLYDWLDLYKFASLFPDAFAGVKGTVHSAEFMTAYAREIRDQCFDEDAAFSCRRRPDVACTPFGDQCTVSGSKLCSEDLSSCDEQSDCPGLLNRCVDRGVCTSDYRTKCAQGVFSSGPTCPGLNRCVDDYGICVPTTDRKCDRLVPHFMGALAHLVTDMNADKFLVHSVAERHDCPSALFDSKERSNDAQFYTDQEMDAYLGSEQGEGLYRFLPTNRSAARVPVEDAFVDQVILNTLDPKGKTGLKPEDKNGYASGAITTWLNQQWLIFDSKVNDKGERFDNWQCRHQPHNAQCDSVDGTHCQTCFPTGIAGENCDVELAKDDKQKGYDGVCTGTPKQPDYVTPCKQSEGCDGLLDRCAATYGTCELVPTRRKPAPESCQWAIDNKHWLTEGGGAEDDATEIAKLMDESWRLMRRGEKLTYRQVGKFADWHLCVGTAAVDCLEEKIQRVIGRGGEEESTPLSGQLSNWSVNRYVEEVGVGQGDGWLRFRLSGDKLQQIGTPEQVACGAGKKLDLELAEDRTEVDRLTDLLFTAMIGGQQVQVRTELTRCSAGDQPLVRNIRIAGNDVIADAGPDQMLECTDSGGAVALLDGTGSYAPTESPLAFGWTAPGIVFDDPTSATPGARFPTGATTTTLRVSSIDGEGDDDVAVIVSDTTPPIVDGTPETTPNTLWPADGGLADVAVQVTSGDTCDSDEPTCSILAIESNSGPGGIPEDAVRQRDSAITGPLTARVRAERNGDGSTRVYTLYVTCLDLSGNATDTLGTVRVPQNLDAFRQSRRATNTAMGFPSTRGWSFEVTEALVVTDLGFWDALPSGLFNPHEVGLWTEAGELLASASVGRGLPGSEEGGFRYVPVESVILVPGARYRIAATLDSGPDWLLQRRDATNLVFDPTIRPHGGVHSSNQRGLLYPRFRERSELLTVLNANFRAYLQMPDTDGTIGIAETQ